ncbi:MAG: hypothetical protein SGPRY_010931 [Prymnesium sp.]
MYAAADGLHEQRDAMIEWYRSISYREAADRLALATVDELKQFLASWPDAKEPRKKMNAASKIASVCEEGKERLDAIVAQRQNQTPCDYTAATSPPSCACRVVFDIYLHHFCQNEKVPAVLQSSIEYRLCRTCAKVEVPNILAQLNTDGVDKLLSDLDVHENFRNLAAKKKFLAARCDYGEDLAEGDE